MEVKKTGKYKTRGGRAVEIYGFDDLGGGPMMAEGFFEDTRNMSWWEPETGKHKSFGNPDDRLVIVQSDDDIVSENADLA